MKPTTNLRNRSRMNDVSALEEHKENLKKLVERRDLAVRLSKNRDFRKLILEEFCVNEAAVYVHNSANPALGPNERADCLGIAQAAGHLKRWLTVVGQMGAQAERDIVQTDQALDDARAEGDDEDQPEPTLDWTE